MKNQRAQVKKISELQLSDFVVFQWRRDPKNFSLCFVQNVEKKNGLTTYTFFSLEQTSWVPFGNIADPDVVTYNIFNPSLDEMRTMRYFSSSLPLVSSSFGENLQLAEEYAQQVGQILQSFSRQYPSEKPCDVYEHAKGFVEGMFFTDDVLSTFAALAERAGESPSKVLSLICDAYAAEATAAGELKERLLQQIDMDKNKAAIQGTLKKLEQAIGLIDVTSPLYQKLRSELDAMNALIPDKLILATSNSKPAAAKE